MVKIPVLRSVTEANALLADALRARFGQQDVLVLNIIASPGAGKTALLERTIESLNGELRLSVIEGDPTTSLDSERVAATGVPVVQINTDGGCHLEARMIQVALEQLDVEGADVVVIENVGNLLCPTGWDLGEDAKVVVASLPEGDDKPLKYPMAFATAQAVVINKIDLQPYLPAQASVLRENALRINPDLAVFEVSALTGQGLNGWVDWIREKLAEKRESRCTKHP
jgi:hydrogenase nickel incorporation protein HypB